MHYRTCEHHLRPERRLRLPQTVQSGREVEGGGIGGNRVVEKSVHGLLLKAQQRTRVRGYAWARGYARTGRIAGNVHGEGRLKVEVVRVEGDGG